jgi:methionyl-tRNA formyltransferase
MKVVLAAEESAGTQMLRALAQSQHQVVAVLTEPPKPGATRVSLWNAAQSLGFETLPADQVRNPALADRLRSDGVDIFLNVHSLYVIHDDVLAAPRLGAFNLHPGPLPRYAGLNVVSWAIFRGEQNHGVTVHRIEPRIDAGPIVYQSSFPIHEEDTALSLSFKCVREGIALLLRLLEVAAAGENIPSITQDLVSRQYFGRDVPEGGCISWQWPAAKVVNFIRACDYLPFASPWGHPQALLGVQKLAVVKARKTGIDCHISPGTVGDVTDSGATVACGDQWILATKLRLEGRCLPAQALLKPGDHLAEVKDLLT